MRVTLKWARKHRKEQKRRERKFLKALKAAKHQPPKELRFNLNPFYLQPTGSEPPRSIGTDSRQRSETTSTVMASRLPKPTV